MKYAESMTLMPVILGPTACGKTAVAVRLASLLDGEIISADSRQVYRGMDIGSGKDLGEYVYQGCSIPYHLIDIAEAGSEYNIFSYQKDFAKAYAGIISRRKLPVLCGGSGMYIEAVLKNYLLPEVPSDPSFAARMAGADDAALLDDLSRLKKLHGTTDTADRNRMLRAIEIEINRKNAPGTTGPGPIPHIIFGINPGREIVRQRITSRLNARLESGLTEEVSSLLGRGITPGRLKAYGLEYKYVTAYLSGELSRDEMFRLLNTAIHQFAKRQMTWFRRMERQGMKIHWIEGGMTAGEKAANIRDILENHKTPGIPGPYLQK
jgi:tRNA dimethylallyltransferase